VEIEGQAGIYRCTEDAVVISFERCTEDSKGVIHAFVTIEDFDEGDRTTLQQGVRENLTSSRSRETLAKHCDQRGNQDRDWLRLISNAMNMAISKLREGEPFLDFAEYEPSEGLDYLVEPILHANQPHLIYGPGGVGKSRLAAYLAAIVQEGYPVPWWSEVEQANVLYLDYETHADELYRTAKGIYAGFGLGVPRFKYRRSFMPLKSDIYEIQKQCLKDRIGLLIVDSAAPATGGDSETQASTGEFFNALRSLNVTSIILGHSTQNQDGSTKPFGSQFWRNMPRATYEVVQQETPNDTYILGMYQRKLNIGRKILPVWLRFAFEEDDSIVTVSKLTQGEIDQQNVGGTPRERIRRLLRSGALNLNQLKAALPDVTNEVIRQTLSRNDEFVSLGSGLWANKAVEVN
jgi:hypothetical protein